MSTLDGPLGTASGGRARELRRPALPGVSGLSSAGAARSGLALVVVGGVLLALAAAHTDVLLPQSIQPVVGSLAGPLASLSFHLRSGEVLTALGLMFLGYVVAVRNAASLSPRLAISGIGLFLLAVLLAPPLISTDLFSYQEYARMFFGLHVNPYTHGSQVLQLDPLYHYISATWISTPTVYGPLFTLISGIFQDTSSTGAIVFSAYAYKVIAALSCLGILVMLWRMAKLRGVDPVRAIVVVGLNPLIVFYGVGGGHNDLLMMLAATAGIWAMLARHARSAGALTVAAAAIKLTAGLFLPFALVAGLAEDARSSGPRLGRRVAAGAAVALIVAFGSGIAIFGSGMTHMVHTLSQVQHEGGWSVPGFFTDILAWGGVGHVISTLFAVIFAAICLWLLRRVYRGQMHWVDGAGWATFWLLMATGSLLPWYVTWLMVPVALSANRRLWTSAAWLCAVLEGTTMVGYLPHAPNILGF